MKSFESIRTGPEDDEKEVLINNMIEGELQSPEELWLHVENVKEYSIGEKLEMLRTGLQKLGYILESDPRLKDVQTISGTSWIVKEHPHLMENLGFTVTEDENQFRKAKAAYESEKLKNKEDYKDGEAAHAYITREKFIELYGFKNDKEIAA